MKPSNCVTTFSFVVFTLGLLANSPAIAASSDAQATPGDSACGTTVEANLAAARKALQSNDRTTRAALACLIAATTSLNEHLRNLDQGRLASGELRAPETDLPLAASRR
jgi:hypothetical protein